MTSQSVTRRQSTAARDRAARPRRRRPGARCRRLGARRLLGHAVQGCRPRGLGLPADRLRGAARAFGPSTPSARASPSTRSRDVDVALPRRESKTGRGHSGFEVTGDPSMSFEEAARRRDFTVNAIALGSADRRIHRSVRRPATICSTARAARRRSADVSRDDSLRVLRGDAVRGALRARRSRRRHATCAVASRSTICPPNGSGARSRNSCCWRRGRRSASRSRSTSASSTGCFPKCTRWWVARRSQNGIPKATSGSTR